MTATTALHSSTHLRDVGDTELVRIVQADAEDARDARAELTERYQPLVIGQSAKLHRGRGDDHQDVISMGQKGLQKAIDAFDTERGTPFAAYARAKVRGELMRWFRDNRYAVHVPRPLHERFMQVRRAQLELESVLHREPEVGEIADHLECSPGEVLEALAVRSAERLRTSQLATRFSEGQEDDRPDPDLQAALQELPERTQRLLYRRFWEGRSQREVGEELGVSQAHVSRLEKRALDTLKESLTVAVPTG